VITASFSVIVQSPRRLKVSEALGARVKGFPGFSVTAHDFLCVSDGLPTLHCRFACAAGILIDDSASCRNAGWSMSGWGSLIGFNRMCQENAGAEQCSKRSSQLEHRTHQSGRSPHRHRK
jgi:hypothetical protein